MESTATIWKPTAGSLRLCGARVPLLLLAGLVALVGPVTAVPSPDWFSPSLVGGAGGERAATVCPKGAFLRGFHARVGDDIDFLKAICAIPPGRSTGSPAQMRTELSEGSMGGPGGSLAIAVCPASAPFVRGVSYGAEGARRGTMVLNQITIACGPLEGGTPRWVDGYNRVTIAGRLFRGGDDIGVGLVEDQSGTSDCPDGMIPAGLHGRAGLVVDAVAVVCRPVVGGANSLPDSRIVTGAGGIETRTRTSSVEQMVSRTPDDSAAAAAPAAPPRGLGKALGGGPTAKPLGKTLEPRPAPAAPDPPPARRGPEALSQFQQDAPGAGGVNGEDYAVSCNDGGYLVGVAGLQAEGVNRVQPLCLQWSPAQSRFLGPLLGRKSGGPLSGAEFRVLCPDGYGLEAIDFAAGEYADGRAVATVSGGRCVGLRNPAERRDAVVAWPGAPNLADLFAAMPPTEPVESQCPEGTFGVGLYGRTAARLVSLGLRCGVRGAPLEIDCAPGYGPRRAAPDDLVCVSPEAQERVALENAEAGGRVDPNGAYGPNSCASGFVWRAAFAGDLACVTPESRDVARRENAQAAQFRNR